MRAADVRLISYIIVAIFRAMCCYYLLYIAINTVHVNLTPWSSCLVIVSYLTSKYKTSRIIFIAVFRNTYFRRTIDSLPKGPGDI